MDLNKICKGCFQEKPEAGGTCPYCGFDEIKYERERDPEVLPLDTVLQGKYVIGKCLGRGGFGITYMGWHANLQTVVAIKEFFPSGIVSRDIGNPDRTIRSDVTMVNTGSTKAYRKSLDGFIKEARTLGGLNLPGVVRVHDFFEENRTAYIVMDYVEGENLSLWLKHSGGRLPEAKVLKLIRPLTGSLQKLHEKGIIHRDISPDNLILQPDGSIMLVDFGAARTVVLEQEAESAVQSMTVVLKPGYAPIEQYNSHGHQGPWTDVYAFCATIFRMLTGAAPADPSTRAVREDDEEMLRASLKSAGVSQRTINALIKGMQLRPQNRCQSMRELEEALYGTTGDEGTSHPSDPSGKKTNRGLITAVLIGAFILATAVIGYTVHSRNSKKQETVERVSEAETQKVSENDYTKTTRHEEITYTLTVENGTGTGTYHTGDRVSITADEKEGYEFSSWKVEKGDISIEGTSLSKATVIVGEEDAKVEAVYTENIETAKYEEATYTLTVENGTGTGDYHTGDTVTIRAEERDGYDFISWKVNQGDTSIEDPSSLETTVVTGARDTEIEAVYTEKAYTVTINGGSIVGEQSSEKYKSGTSISIKADIPDGYFFGAWNIEAGGITLSDPSAERTTFVMEDEDVQITAVTRQYPVLIRGSAFNEQLKMLSGSYKESFTDIDEIIESIIFTDDPVPAGVETASFSESGDPVTAWFDQGSRTIYISTQADKIYLKEYSSGMFHNFAGLKNLDMSIVDTSSVTEMQWMFEGCSSLVSLDLSSFDTSSVTDMYSMFDGCSSLRSLDVSGFNTSSVTGMGMMFEDCNSLSSLDLSSFDTSSVTDMAFMFSGCSNLSSLDLSNFDTSSVRDMGRMFDNCSSLVSLDLSSFDTSSVTFMGGMFSLCSSLSSLDISSFDTSSVTNMQFMFHGCSNLTKVITDNQVLQEAYAKKMM